MKYLIVFMLFCIQYIRGQNTPVVNTTQGVIRGLAGTDGDYFKYLGIPYGVVNRTNPFGPSSPSAPFETPFDATDDSAICPQYSGAPIGSLDCLHLNVFTPASPASSTNLPVLIFIHGGAFQVGSFGSYIYNPKFLVRHELIVVTLNYRLGPFGFMCTDDPKIPGNQGFKDQLIALRWVNENIGFFGGDASKVTLVGNSAGSSSVDLQIIKDHDPQLFNQAIFQSGTSFIPYYIAPERKAPLIISEKLGFQTANIDEAIHFLSNIEPSEIIVAVNQLGLSFKPCVERSFQNVEGFITENWMKKEIIPSAKDFKIMIGINDNEALGLFITPGQNFTNILEESLRTTFDIDNGDFQGLSTVRHFFIGDEEIGESKIQEIINLRSDLSFVYDSIGSMRSIDRFLKSEAEKVYLYLFAYDGERNLLKHDLNITHHGAAHADELGYLWGVSYLGEPSEKDEVVVDRMTMMWANFVKYGDPTPDLTDLLPVKWEAITPTSPYYFIHIDGQLQAGTRPFSERMAFWDLFYETNALSELYMTDF